MSDSCTPISSAPTPTRAKAPAVWRVSHRLPVLFICDGFMALRHSRFYVLAPYLGRFARQFYKATHS